MNTLNQQQQVKPDLIIGLGASGRSVASWMSAQGMPFAMADSRAELPESEVLARLYPDAELFLGNLDDLAIDHYQRLIVSPGVPPTLPIIQSARESAVPVIGDIELFAAVTTEPVTAVTGSNGKSTVVHLLSQMYADANVTATLGGNFGTPALDLLAVEDSQRHILELSSFQLETTDSLQVDAACVLNISEDHMDRYESLDDYVKAKGRIYDHCRTAIVNRDDAYSVALASNCDQQVSFGLDRPEKGQFGIIEEAGKIWLAKGETLLLNVSELKIFGRHNQANALAALALAEAGGIQLQDGANTLRHYQGLSHRTQWVAETAGIQWLNDSKATNVGATIAALQGLDHPVVLIAGGQGKDADFSPLRSVVEQHVKAVILMGEDAETLFRALRGSTAISLAKDMQDAVAQARKLAAKGDYVLLSPACASFDQYSGYVERGETYIRCVKELAEVG